MFERCSQRCPTQREDARTTGAEYVFLTRMHERLRGLLFREPDAKVRVLVPCGAVHTFGMAHKIDVAFLDGEGTVLAVYRDVGKHRRLRCAGARMTLERFANERPWFSVGERAGLESTCRED